MAPAPPIQFDRAAARLSRREAAREAAGAAGDLSVEGHQTLVLLAQTLDRQPHAVARFEELRRLHAETDTRRRAGRDDVAGQQGHEMADIADDVVDPEDQIGGIAVLYPPAVDLGPQPELARIGHLIGGDDPRTDRGESVGALALGPLAAALDLKFALGNIVHDAVAGDVFVRIVGGDIPRQGADHDAELDLPVGLLRGFRNDNVVL